MSTKRYFWLKLKDDFFNQKEIKMLRRIAGGDTYTVIYLKLLLLSLKNEGKIYFDGIADNFTDEIALDIDEDVENVQVTINFLSQKGLIEFSDDEHEFYLSNIASMIGSETDAARRKRKQRLREKSQKSLESSNCDSVTQMSQVGHIEKELEKELDIELEQETEEEPEKEPAAPDPQKVYEENFGAAKPLTAASIAHWVDALGPELVTVRKKANPYQKPVREESLPSWFGKEIVDDDPVDPEVERELRERLRALREGN